MFNQDLAILTLDLMMGDAIEMAGSSLVAMNSLIKIQLNSTQLST